MMIKAEGQFTTRDIWRGSRQHSRRGQKICSFVGLVMLVVATCLSITTPKGWQPQVPLFALGLFWILWCPLFVALGSRRTVKRSPNLQGTIRYRFSETGYEVEAAHSRSEVKWTALAKQKEGKHEFLFYTSPKIAQIIPKRFFQTAAEIEALRSFLERNVTQKIAKPMRSC